MLSKDSKDPIIIVGIMLVLVNCINGVLYVLLNVLSDCQ